MTSDFLNIVMPILENKKIDITSFQNDRLKDMDKQFDKDKNVSGAVSSLRKEFSFKLSDDDYRKITKELGYKD